MKHSTLATFISGIALAFFGNALAQDTGSKQSMDQQFATQAYNISNAEVQMGKMAKNKGASQQVKDYGQMMVNDHSLAIEQLKRVTKNSKLTLPTKLDAQHQAAMDHLKQLSGREFDQAYLQHMVSGHQQAIDAFKKAADESQSIALKNYADTNLPLIRAHHEIARKDTELLNAKPKA